MTFNSLSKAYCPAGYRAGWMVVSGPKADARDYIEGLNMLANLKLGSNVPGQWAIQTARGYQSINDLVRLWCLRRQRDLAYESSPRFPVSPGVSRRRRCTCSRLDPAMYPIADDRQFFMEVLRATRVMLVQGSGLQLPGQPAFPHRVPAARGTTCARPSAGWRASCRLSAASREGGMRLLFYSL